MILMKRFQNYIFLYVFCVTVCSFVDVNFKENMMYVMILYCDDEHELSGIR